MKYIKQQSHILVAAIQKHKEVSLGITLFALIGLLIAVGSTTLPSSSAAKTSLTNQKPTQQVSARETKSSNTKSEQQSKLTDSTANRYRAAFTAQKKANWTLADQQIADKEDRLLQGHLLAQRYLHKKYKSTKAELTAWLELYADHPQAKRIAQLARKKGAKVDTPKLAKRRLKGFGESFNSSRNKSPRIAGTWKSGLNHWKKGRYAKAYNSFNSLEKRTKTMGDWDRAAISFWAYRAADKLKNKANAQKHLQNAAAFPRSFYGAQAIHLLGDTLNESIELRGEESFTDYVTKVESIETKQALRRIEALLAVGQNKMAQDDLLLHYARADVEDRVAFVPLVQKLNLPALQLRMGVDMERKGVTSGKALYPLPQWQPEDGFMVDPALVFAIARQESGFNNKARSYSGARGTMQIMPQTAKYIAKKMNHGKKLRLNDADTSMNLGQNYLDYLANKPYIRGNVVLLAAAYNAGPGNAKRWSKRPSMMQDPLYFVETIPFSETRNYVMNVMTNYWMYREIMSDEDPGVTLLSEGKWPITSPKDTMVTARVSELLEPSS